MTSKSSDYLLTLARYLSEVGTYASTLLSDESLDFAEECEDQLAEVLRELKTRGAIETEEDIYEIPDTDLSGIPLSEMTIAQLELLYRQTIRDFRRSLALSSLCKANGKRETANGQQASAPGTGHLQSIISELLSRQQSSANGKRETANGKQCSVLGTGHWALEELKIAYCLDTYRNELHYLSSLNGTEASLNGTDFS